MSCNHGNKDRTSEKLLHFDIILLYNFIVPCIEYLFINNVTLYILVQ